MTFSLHVAIEAMKNAHKEEMEKTHRSQLTGLNSDIDELRLQYEYVAFYLCNYLFIYLFMFDCFDSNTINKQRQHMDGIPFHRLLIMSVIFLNSELRKKKTRVT